MTIGKIFKGKFVQKMWVPRKWSTSMGFGLELGTHFHHFLWKWKWKWNPLLSHQTHILPLPLPTLPFPSNQTRHYVSFDTMKEVLMEVEVEVEVDVGVEVEVDVGVEVEVEVGF